MVLCPGDIAGYGDKLEESITLLQGCECHTILGNHDIWYLEDNLELPENETTHYLRNLPLTLDFNLEGKKVYMVHASPPASIMDGIRLLDENGEIIPQQKSDWSTRLCKFDYDVLIIGHTHQVFAEQLGNTLVINPGSSQFNHTCGILTLPDMQFQLFALSDKTPIRSWNWGLFYANNARNTD